ncbi:hypothetical protein RCH09_003295 [Actimicrobium sp. GrIS 1.19]|uniref:GNAT family N-acetyltransferase n=1 Tax=Actimicrobium sp. GrIS 1.19 TaxID=3071708 RepID=UPI002DFB576E|nr:hypothetical protein [Actimicrobium sp. GrIS 1.19]
MTGSDPAFGSARLLGQVEFALTLPPTHQPQDLLPKMTGHLRRHVRAFDAKEACPDWWEPLYRIASNAAIFLSRDWMETWIGIYGAEFTGNWVWWSCNGVVVGGCLLLRKTARISVFFMPTLYLNAGGATSTRSPLAEHNDVLFAPGHEDAIVSDLTEFLSTLAWSRIVLSGCCANGIIERVIAAIPQSRSDLDHKPAPYVNIESLRDAPFLTQVSSNTRAQVKRSQRVYEAESGPVSLVAATDLDTGMEFFDELATLHNERWAGKGVAGSFSSQSAVAFHRALIRRLWSSGGVKLLRVTAGQSTVGVLYNFISDGAVFFYQSGFAWQQNSQLKPGLLTHCLAIEHCRIDGLREYDFLAGDSQYKRSLSTHQRHLFWATVYRARGGVKVFLMAQKFKRLLMRLRARAIARLRK